MNKLIIAVIIFDIFLFWFVHRAEGALIVSSPIVDVSSDARLTVQPVAEQKVKKQIINGKKTQKNMSTKMNTKIESVTCIYDGQGHLVAIVKRDDLSKKSSVYIVRDAKVDDIARMINGDSDDNIATRPEETYSGMTVILPKTEEDYQKLIEVKGPESRTGKNYTLPKTSN